jgi:hypothetical protein
LRYLSNKKQLRSLGRRSSLRISILGIGKILDILRTSAASIFHAYAVGQKNVKKYTPGNAGSLNELPRGGALDPFPGGFRNSDRQVRTKLIRETALIIVHRVLTLPKITVKPALIPTVGQTKIPPFSRGIGTLEGVGCSKLFDLSHTIQYGVRYLLYDKAGGRVEPNMSVLTFDGEQVFQQRGLTGALLCEDGVLIRSHGKSLLGSEEKQCCLFRGGFSLSIYQGHLKLSESPVSSGQIPTCTAWLRGSRSQC